MASMDVDDRQSYCYLTTTGRRTRRPHTIEIWFGTPADRPGRIYLLSGGGERSDWVRNLRVEPGVTVRIGEVIWQATASVVDDPDEDAIARALLATKYQGWREGQPMSSWARTALPVALDIGPPSSG
jgi:deazaflavin-dependent oxidoreductase (nitroreductase family)